MKKARAAVEGKVAGIVGGTDSNSGAGAAVETKSLVAAINRDARLTFSYLLMQLHARGGQTFWVSATGTFSITSSDNIIYLPFKKGLAFLDFRLPSTTVTTAQRETAAEDIFAYIAFRVTDIYADILTHIEAEGFRCAPLLEELCSVPTMDNWRELYTGLRVEIMKQRQQKVDAWSPSYVLTPVPALILFFVVPFLFINFIH